MGDLNKLKAKESLKDEIDQAFLARYRISPSGKQEEFDRANSRWQLCDTNEQHIIRFLMQWVLVRVPTMRRYTLHLYGHLLRDK